jgi:hypothetical protein
MSKQRPAFLKPLLLSYAAVSVFTAISIIAPILLGRTRKDR